MSEFKIGDRVWLLSAGWDTATIKKLEPLTIEFDNVEKVLKVPKGQQQWLRHCIYYPMPNVGDIIKINNKHLVSAGQEFVVAEIQEAGWVKTTKGSLFHFDFFERKN